MQVTRHDLEPLANHADTPPVGRRSNGSKNKKGSKAIEDDTPKEFRRLLERQKHLTQGHKKRQRGDDTAQSTLSNKKRKPNAATQRAAISEPAEPRSAMEIPRIKPYERLSDFGARVDCSMPVSGLMKKGNKAISIGGKKLKQPQTKTERKMQKMQAEWREQAARRKQKEDEAADERELEELAGDGYRVADEVEATRKRVVGKKKKGKEDDPWAVLESRRKVQKNLGDVVQRPPDLRGLKGARLKIDNQ